MDDGGQKRSGKQRTAEYRARLIASREPTIYAVGRAVLAVVVDAARTGENIAPASIIQRASGRVCSDPKFSQEGFDNVVARIAQPVNRRRRLA